MIQENMLALVDLDGTLANFSAEMDRSLNLLKSPDEPVFVDTGHDDDDPPHIKERKSLIKSRPGFWRGLKRIESGFDIVSVLKNFNCDIQILTKGPYRHSNAWAEKLEWVQAQPELVNVPVNMANDKGMVYGRILVDDWPKFADSWLAHRPRGLLIMPAQPWNEKYKSDTKRVLRYTGDKKELFEVLKNFQQWLVDRAKPFII